LALKYIMSLPKVYLSCYARGSGAFDHKRPVHYT
jgi:hypothetical protein